MSQKPDFYEVLGVAKTASETEIKAAFKKIMMLSHEDMVRNKLKKAGKSETEIAAAIQEAKKAFQLATEAKDVLTDPKKRNTYDQHGHQGLANLGTGPGYSEAAGERVKRKSPTEEDLFDFFDKAAEKNPRPSTGRPGESSADRRARAAEERRKAREAARGEIDTPSVQEEDTEDTSEKIAEATSRLRNETLSLKDLQLIRDKAADLVEEIDAAIARARRNNGPRP